VTDVWKTLLIGLGVSLATAWVTVRLSVRQFSTERWWERQAETYSAVVESLAAMLYALERDYERVVEDRQIAEAEITELWKHFADGRKLIELRARTGAFAISEPVAAELRQLIAKLETENREGNWIEDLDNHAAATRHALTIVVKLAKQDLRVSRRFFRKS